MTSTDLKVEEVGVANDEEAQKAIARFLSANTYEHPTIACIREYANNALDAQREAGNPDPIEVILPSAANNNTFVVRDQGIGMSMDDIMTCYKQFFKSTKRQDKNANGHFGVGAKVGYAIAQQFTVVSVKDGMKSIVTFSNDISGDKFAVAPYHEPTDEPNGTTITLAVENKLNKSQYTYLQKDAVYLEWYEAATHVFELWPENTVMVDGEIFKPLSLTQLTENSFIRRSQNVWTQSKLIIRMANTRYDVDFTFIAKELDGLGLVNQFTFVIDMPNKSIDATLSREKLVLDENAKKLLHEEAVKMRKAIIDYNQRIIDQCHSLFASDMQNPHIGVFGTIWNDNYTFKNHSLKLPALGWFSSVSYRKRKGEDILSVNTAENSSANFSYRGIPTTNDIIITHCGENDISKIRAKISKIINSPEYLTDAGSFNDNTRVFYRINDLVGIEEVFNTYNLTYDEVNDIYKEIQKTERELRNIEKQRIRELIEKGEMLEEEVIEKPEKVLRKYTYTESMNEDRNSADIDQLVEMAKNKEFVYLFPGIHQNSTNKSIFIADKKYNLFIEAEGVDRGVLKRRFIKEGISFNEYAYAYGDLQKQWPYAPKKLRDQLSLDEYRELTPMLEKLSCLYETLETKKLKSKEFKKYIELSTLIFGSENTRSKLNHRGEYYAYNNPIVQWLKKHPLLSDELFMPSTLEGKCDLIDYINKKNIPWPEQNTPEANND